MDLDRENEAQESSGLPAASASFSSTLFRQPALAEGRIRPAVYRKPGARSSIDVFGTSSRPAHATSQRRSVDGDFEVYDEVGVLREGVEERKGESRSAIETRTWRSPLQSALTEGLLAGASFPDGLEVGSQSDADANADADERLNESDSDDGEERNAELELEVDEILSTENTTQPDAASLSNTLLNHLSPTKVLFN